MKALESKVAIITGAAKGIGESTALLFAKEGAKVVVSDIDEENGKKVTEAIKKDGGEALFVKSDASKPKDHEELVKKTVDAFGKLDIAVNNAGIGGSLAQTAEYPVDDWDNVIKLNLSGVFYGTKYQIAEMMKNGGGSIVNIASILGQVGTANSPAYVAAKHGVVGLTKTAAIEYAQENIRVNAVGPGYIKTPLLDALDDETLEYLVSQHPIGRLGKPEEVAEIILWLASDKASFVTGNYYAVDGGYLAK
ncbi:MAG: SDR family oxidoreductase [Gracilimonas sp.]|uniref:SDR family NAD(P)-dependent oxidoreductase n=1 Tax=Gracilimonas sp. TaxID=1974203 RepID=UPI003752A9FB|nr:SDR family oxidoreductase [Gracilimonas sp.]